MGSQSPKPFEWTPQSIDTFWSMVAQSPLAEDSFGRICGEKVTDTINILDFGAGDGDISHLLLQKGFHVAVYEPASERNHVMQEKNFAQFPNFLGYLSPRDIQENRPKFNAVLCFEVLEHIHPLFFDQTLQSIKDLLASGGKLIGSVPNAENLKSQYRICPQCGTQFHRWQHMRSINDIELYNMLEGMGMNKIYITVMDLSLLFIASKIITK